jgi:hypothetical protein
VLVRDCEAGIALASPPVRVRKTVFFLNKATDLPFLLIIKKKFLEVLQSQPWQKPRQTTHKGIILKNYLGFTKPSLL